MKTKKFLQTIAILLTFNSSLCTAQFTLWMNPWGFNITGSTGTYGHHFFDIDSNESIDHLMSYTSNNSSEFLMNFNKSVANTTPNFSNCTNESFMNYWQMADSIYGLYQPGQIILGTTTKFFDLDNDGDQDMITSALNFDVNVPDAVVSVYQINENKRNASPFSSAGFDCLYYYDETKLAYNLPAKVSTDSIAVHIFDIGHLTKSTSKDIIALELGKPDTAAFVLYQDTSTGNSPSYIARQNNPFGLSSFIADNPKSMPLLLDADADGDNDIIILAGPNDYNVSWYYYQNTGTVSAPNFSTPFVKNPFGLTTFSVGNTQDNLIVLYKIDGNFDGKDDIILGNDSKVFYFENNYTAPIPTPTSISNNTLQQLNVYPNPAKDVLTISNYNNSAVSLKIIDARGVIVAQQKIANTISVANYANGVYQIIMIDDKNSIVDNTSFIKL